MRGVQFKPGLVMKFTKDIKHSDCTVAVRSQMTIQAKVVLSLRHSFL